VIDISKLCLLATALSLGCVANTQKNDGESASANVTGAETTDLPVLAFGADWSVTQTGTLVAGGRAIVRYDVARLPKCRTYYRGHWAWDIVADYAADGGFAREVPLTKELATGERVGVDVVIDVPIGRDLAVWFQSSDEGGCHEWDSSYGRNYHFAIESSGPALHFRTDWSIGIEGTPASGGDVWIDYELARLATCRATYNGYQTWDVMVAYRFDGGPIQQASLTTVVGMTGRGPAPARLHVPAGARELTVWFENVDRSGCHAWDSAYGANYRFSLR
jgi:hypothetical protein